MRLQYVPGLALFVMGIAALGLAALASDSAIGVAMVVLAGALMCAGVFGHRSAGETHASAQGVRTTLTSPAVRDAATREGVGPATLDRIAARLDALHTPPSTPKPRRRFTRIGPARREAERPRNPRENVGA